MRKLFAILLLIAGVACGGGSLWYWYYLTTGSPGQGEAIVTIPKGSGVRGIGKILAEEGVLRYDLRFLVMVYFSGFKSSLQAGEYGIARGLTPPEVLRLLAKGSTRRHRVTIPEGLTAEQIAGVLAKDGWAESGQFLALTRDGNFIKGLGIDAASLEGYLFPETYTLTLQDAQAPVLIRMMVDRFRSVWRSLPSPQTYALTPHQIVTLASIVEKETGTASERPLIARVFLNRLALGMRLQSDPTVIYGLAEFSGNLTKADLKQATPYNTYVIPSLPPGPICNPGQAALEAVMTPAVSDALYFVSRNDGSHVFSRNLEEHNQAVRTFQKKTGH